MRQFSIVALFLSGLVSSIAEDYPSQYPTPAPREMKPSKEITIRLFRANFHSLSCEMVAGFCEAKPNKIDEYLRNLLSHLYILCFCEDMYKDELQILFSALFMSASDTFLKDPTSVGFNIYFLIIQGEYFPTSGFA
jgi:hypothetical protein